MISKYPKLNLLVAFPYFSKSIYELLLTKDPNSFRLIVDSGAFTAWNTGKQISLDDYANFLKTIPSQWEYKAVQLDVYGEPEQTYTNYLKMLDMGFKDIMPVFTRGDTIERLNEFYTYTDYIMFGGIAIGGENKNYVKWFCEMNKERKAHWLGFVNMSFIKHYKPFSVDSSSLYSAQRYGNLQYYIGNGDLKTIHRTELYKQPPIKVIENLKKLNFTMKDIALLANQDAWEGGASPPKAGKVRGMASFMNVTSHLKRAIEVEKHLGTKIYLALGNADQIQNVYDALELIYER
jgi:hypothetical protein